MRIKKSIFLPVGQPPYCQNCYPTLTSVLWANSTKFERIWPIFSPPGIYCSLVQHVACLYNISPARAICCTGPQIYVFAVQYGIYYTGSAFDMLTVIRYNVCKIQTWGQELVHVQLNRITRLLTYHLEIYTCIDCS